MRLVPDEDGTQRRRLREERSRRESAELVPRPGCPIYGLAAPPVRPVTLAGTTQFNGEWTQLTLAYGPWDAQAGPYVRVTTAVTAPDFCTSDGMHGTDPEAELRRAVLAEIDRPSQLRPAAGTGTDTVPGTVPGTVEPDQPPPPRPLDVTRERLPAGQALVVRDGPVWAARLVPDEESAVVVTVVGRDIPAGDVRLETLTDLRAAIEGRNAEQERIIEERRRNPRPQPLLPDLEPAEGVAALRALADYTLATRPDRRSARGAGEPRRALGWGIMYSLLWRRAVLEQQRVAGMDASAADEAVTSAVNHVGHLAEKAPWFAADERLRAAAIDETLRHAMLGEAVPSQPAQRAWSGYWSSRQAQPGHPAEHAAIMAWHESISALKTDWLGAWEAWTRDA